MLKWEGVVRAVPLSIAVIVTACGGGGGTGDLQAGLSSRAADVPPVTLSTATFVERAQNEPCAETRNRLFLIDKAKVFWDRAGNCPDNGSARRLLGKTPDAVLCSAADTIAGPRVFCADEQARPLFDTILKNLDKADLGLGAGHTVEAMSFLPKGATAIAFESIAHDAYSGVSAAKSVVVKDAGSWKLLWEEHNSWRAVAPALPALDFSKSMVVAVFLGSRPSGCYATEISRVYRADGVIHVEHVDAVPGPQSACTQSITAPSHMVVMDRGDDPVRLDPELPKFGLLPQDATQVAFESIVHDVRPGLGGLGKNVVVKDAASWARLWTEYAADTTPAPALPKIDFNKSMVIGVMTAGPNGCSSVDITGVVRKAGAINVDYTEPLPSPLIGCTAAFVTPWHLVMTDRSDDPVVFTPHEAAGVYFSSIPQDTYPSVATAMTVVVKDAESWERLGGKQTNLAVDFSKSMIVAVFMGTRPNGCYATAIQRVFRMDGVINVNYVDTVPNPQMVCTGSATMPAHIVVLDRSDDAIRFIAETRTAE